MTEERKPKFYVEENLLPTVINRVAKVCGLHLTEIDLGRMAVIASACGIADDIFDQCDNPERRRAITEDALSYLGGKTKSLIETGNPIQPAYEESMSRLKDLAASFEIKRRESFISFLRIWAGLSEARRTETDVERSIRLRIADLGFNACIYLFGTSEETRKRPGYEDFLRATKKIVRICGMFDDTADLPRDKREGVVAFDASITNRTRLSIYGLRLISNALKQVGHPQVLGTSLKAFAREFRRRGDNNFEQYLINDLTN